MYTYIYIYLMYIKICTYICIYNTYLYTRVGVRVCPHGHMYQTRYYVHLSLTLKPKLALETAFYTPLEPPLEETIAFSGRVWNHQVAELTRQAHVVDEVRTLQLNLAEAYQY